MALLTFTAGPVFAEQTQPRIENARLDLSNFALEGPPLKLQGRVEYYPDVFLKPGDSAFQSPNSYIPLSSRWKKSRGFGTLRFLIRLPQKTKTLALKIGIIHTAFHLYVNGTLISSGGNPGKSLNTSRPYRDTKIVRLPVDSRQLELIWHISSFRSYSLGLVNPIYIGSEDGVRGLRRKLLFRDMFLIGMALIMGLYYLGLFWVRRKNRSNFYFGVLCIMIGGYGAFIGETGSARLFPFLSFSLNLKLSFIFSFLSVWPVLYYIRQIFPLDLNHKTVKIFSIVFVIELLGISILPPQHFSLGTNIFLIVLLLGIAVIIKTMFRSVFKLRKSSFVVFMGFLPLLISTANDVLNHRGYISTGYFSHIGLATFISAQAAILLSWVVNSFHRSEDLSLNLEFKNKQLKDLKYNLEQRVEERTARLTQAQRIADIDLKLAVQIQNSLFQENLPNLRNWEVAVHFQPQRGVSGDIYEFYHSSTLLHGVALFDVSGKGIAAGLIGLTARTVARRIFLRNRHRLLGETLQKINQEIINQIGRLDNYLTGILIRIEGDRVHYSNAAHPPLLLRDAASGNAGPIAASLEEISGRPLGIDEQQGLYGQNCFRLYKDDLLVLFSDGLSKSRDSDGKPLGPEGVTEFLKECRTGDSAAKALLHILERRRRLNPEESIQDDLTIIVLRKLGER